MTCVCESRSNAVNFVRATETFLEKVIKYSNNVDCGWSAQVRGQCNGLAGPFFCGSNAPVLKNRYIKTVISADSLDVIITTPLIHPLSRCRVHPFAFLEAPSFHAPVNRPILY